MIRKCHADVVADVVPDEDEHLASGQRQHLDEPVRDARERRCLAELVVGEVVEAGRQRIHGHARVDEGAPLVRLLAAPARDDGDPLGDLFVAEGRTRKPVENRREIWGPPYAAAGTGVRRGRAGSDSPRLRWSRSLRSSQSARCFSTPSSADRSSACPPSVSGRSRCGSARSPAPSRAGAHARRGGLAVLREWRAGPGPPDREPPGAHALSAGSGRRAGTCGFLYAGGDCAGNDALRGWVTAFSCGPLANPVRAANMGAMRLGARRSTSADRAR
jgi:hypothetical protein